MTFCVKSGYESGYFYNFLERLLIEAFSPKQLSNVSQLNVIYLGSGRNRGSNETLQNEN